MKGWLDFSISSFSVSSLPLPGRKLILVQNDSPESGRAACVGTDVALNHPEPWSEATAMQPHEPTLKMLIREAEEARDEYCRLLIAGNELLKRARTVSRTIEERVRRETGRNSFPSTQPLQDSAKTV